MQHLFNFIVEDGPSPNFIEFFALLFFIFILFYIIQFFKVRNWNLLPILFGIPVLTFILGIFGLSYGVGMILNYVGNIPVDQRIAAIASSLGTACGSLVFSSGFIFVEFVMIIILIQVRKIKFKIEYVI